MRQVGTDTRSGPAERPLASEPMPAAAPMPRSLRTADDVDVHVGSRVRMRRMTMGISQEQLGDHLGLTFQQIQKYEKGQNRIGAGRLYRIAQVLNVSVNFFYEGLPGPEAADGHDVPRHDPDATVKAFLVSPDGHALAESFLQISDGSTRKRLVDLVSTIAQDGS